MKKEAAATTAEEASEDDDFDLEPETFELTPEGIVRRAAYNKKLRCRRNYGPYEIPVAFVKSKVAVYVGGNAQDPNDAKLKEEGWLVLRFKESEVTDGQAQVEEIKEAMKENARNLKKAKKK